MPKEDVEFEKTRLALMRAVTRLNVAGKTYRLLKNVLRLSFAVQRTQKYASRLRIPGALHPGIFEQPVK